MKPEGLQPSKPDFARRFVIVALCILAVFLLGKTALRKWQERESVRVEKERGWIRQAVQRLEQAGPPPKDLGQSPPYAPWVVPGYFVFSNGWAAYDLHSFHASDGMGDIALLRLSDGRLYTSKMHFCGGITDMMQPSGSEQLPRPADAKDFFENCGRFQQWNLLSPDGRLSCAVICPDADRAKKTKKALWVSISAPHGNSETNLFERRYTFSGNYVEWTTRWNSNEDLVIDVFDYVLNPMTHLGPEAELPTNHLATLSFHRDRRTGRFTDEKR